ncbi:PTS galactitol transporter subunit IIC [Anaerobacillus alkalidiazotrophicus]|uniref:PTS galactitol transporter subunit IIC n=1 Tax=Anaerobacillus alkalidiazotrophicus TaxID=472963 RepID=A0A1S2M5N4_9BACI|nr:PTS transporter subunit IIC [Anaerobacillus alkalidiazotrophicus]OIJ18945.1 PTS galactitol transporter subunit IIC [Anaerobacillus alkalidiazotrophicus]
MEALQSIFDYILGFGAAVFVPLILIIVGLIARMKFKDAFSSGLTLGLAFVGMGLVIGFMMDAMGPAARQFVDNTGIELTAIDGGWTSLATLAWAWPLAFFMFPIQIGINAIMLLINKTNTLNVDLWNVWGKILTAVLVIGVSGSVTLAFIVASLQIIIELKVADVNQKQIGELTQIPGVTSTHSMTLFGVFLYPLNRLLDFVPGLDRKIDADWLKERIGIFAENHVMGFIIGILLGVTAKYNIQEILILGVQAAAALTLFPMVAKLFMQALAPLSDAISEFMRKRFEGKELHIGLDWPIMAGCNEVWVTCIVLVPFTLMFAAFLPGNNVLPFAGIINLSFAVAALIVTGGNLLRMIILGVVTTPVFLYVATYFAPTITKLANDTGAITVPAGQLLSWSTLEYPVFRYVFANAANVVNGQFWGLVAAIIWMVLFVWYYKGMKKRSEMIEKNADKIA